MGQTSAGSRPYNVLGSDAYTDFGDKRYKIAMTPFEVIQGHLFWH